MFFACNKGKNVQSIRSDARLEDLVSELNEIEFHFLFRNVGIL